MNQYGNTSEKGRLAVLRRWNKKEEEFNKVIEIGKTKKDYSYHLSRLLGFLAGDGSIFLSKTEGSTHYCISFYPDILKLAELFEESFRYCYNVSPKIKEMKNYFHVRVNNKTIYSNIKSISSFGVLKWKVPLNILLSDELKKEWIRAFFDCEAYVGKKIIQVQSVNNEGLGQIKKILKEFNIDSKIYRYERKNKNWNANYLLCIMKKDSKRRYLKEIGFNHPIKLEKLRGYCQDG